MLKPDDITGALASPTDPKTVFDYDEALARLDGDSELLAEMASLFVESYGEQVADIGAGLARGDAKAVESAAHALKGAVGNFASRAAFQAAQKLEELGRRGDLTDAGRIFTELEGSLALLTAALLAFTRGTVPAY